MQKIFQFVVPLAVLIPTMMLNACIASVDLQAPISETGPTSLAEVKIPEQFQFATVRPVTLRVSADALVWQGSEQGLVKVFDPAGGELYRGPLLAGRTETIEVSLPAQYDTVQLHLDTPRRLFRGDTAVNEYDKATYTFVYTPEPPIAERNLQ